MADYNEVKSLPFSSLWSGLSPLLYTFPCHSETSTLIGRGTPLHLTLKRRNTDLTLLLDSEINSLTNATVLSKPVQEITDTIILSEDEKDDSIGEIISKQSHLMQSCVSCYGGIQLSQKDLSLLSPLKWLNDQVINCYMKLVMKNAKDNIYITNTFFYSKLDKTGFKGVLSWLKKVNMNKVTKLLIPVHLPRHWSLVFINLQRKKIKFYDSLGLYDTACLKKIQDFAIALSRHFKLSPKLDNLSSQWKCVRPKNMLLQKNGSDCGVFICLYARWICLYEWDRCKYYSRLSSKDIREHMRKELTQEQLLPITINY